MSLLLLVLLAADPAAKLAKLDDDAAKVLGEMLASKDGLERQLALERQQQQRQLVRDAHVPALIACLDDVEWRLPGDCLALKSRELKGEGEYEALGRCERRGQSNAKLAASLLPQGSCRAIAAAVAEKPARLEVLGQHCTCADVAPLLDAKRPEASLVALLRLAGACEAASPLVADERKPVREAAAIATLPKPEAVKVIEAGLADPSRGDLVHALADVRQPALGPALVQRLSRASVNEAEALRALAVMSPAPQGLAPVVRKYLKSPEPSLIEAALWAARNVEGRALRGDVLAVARKQIDLGVLFDTVAAMGPATQAELKPLVKAWERACHNEPFSYHMDSNADFCSHATESLERLALEAGMRFAPTPIW